MTSVALPLSTDAVTPSSLHGEAMFGCLFNLPVFHVLQHIFQEDLCHALTIHGGEADWSVVPRALLFTLSENGYDPSLSLVTGNFT